jgi:hypothetical protein
MKVKIDIGRLVLEGVDLPPHQRPELQAAVEAELARLIQARGIGSTLLAGGWERTRAAAPMAVAAGTGAETLGWRIAEAVYGSLWR